MVRRKRFNGILKQKNGREQPWTIRINILRVSWWFASLLFYCSPKNFYSFRNFLLRLFGAQIGHSCQISRLTRISFPWNLKLDDNSSIGDYVDVYPLGSIHIKSDVCISQYAKLIAGTHDYKQNMKLLKSSIIIGNDSWICYGAYIGPNVIIGDNVIVGAMSVVVKPVPSNSKVYGNPANDK